MRFMIVSCVFPPEPVVSAQTSAQLAQDLVSQGHHVTVLASFPNRPAGRFYPGYKRQIFKKEISKQGYEIIRCFSSPSPGSSVSSRFLENLTFGLSSGIRLLFSRRPDAIYSNSWPIFATGILLWVALLKRIPVVVSVQDIYPESLIIQGRLSSNSLIARFLSWVDGIISRRSHAIIVISRRFAEIYRKTRMVAENNIHIVPNWMESDYIDLKADRATIRQRYRLPESALLVVYAGNVGAAAGVETAVEAFKYLDDFPNVYFLIAGEGSSLENCKKLAQHIGIDRVLFHSPWRAEDTSSILQAGDVLLLPTRGFQSLVSVPSKLISYMLASKPVLALALPGSDIGDIILEAKCGWVVEPDQPEAVAEKIIEINNLHHEQKNAMGKAGREYALCHFIKDVNLPKVISILQQAGKP